MSKTKSTEEIASAVFELIDGESRQLSREDYRGLLEEIISDAQIRLDCMDEEDATGEH